MPDIVEDDFIFLDTQSQYDAVRIRHADRMIPFEFPLKRVETQLRLKWICFKITEYLSQSGSKVGPGADGPARPAHEVRTPDKRIH